MALGRYKRLRAAAERVVEADMATQKARDAHGTYVRSGQTYLRDTRTTQLWDAWDDCRNKERQAIGDLKRLLDS